MDALEVSKQLEALSGREINADDAEELEEDTVADMGRLTAAFSELSDRERFVLELRYGLGGDGQRRTLDEVGRVLDRTRERVRQIENEALQKLADRLSTNEQEESLAEVLGIGVDKVIRVPEDEVIEVKRGGYVSLTDAESAVPHQGEYGVSVGGLGPGTQWYSGTTRLSLEGASYLALVIPGKLEDDRVIGQGTNIQDPRVDRVYIRDGAATQDVIDAVTREIERQRELLKQAKEHYEEAERQKESAREVVRHIDADTVRFASGEVDRSFIEGHVKKGFTVDY